MVLALDIIGDGHYTRYGNETDEAWMLQVPFRDGFMPEIERERWDVVEER